MDDDSSKGSMYLYGRCLSLKGVPTYIGTLRPNIWQHGALDLDSGDVDDTDQLMSAEVGPDDMQASYVWHLPFCNFCSGWAG